MLHQDEFHCVVPSGAKYADILRSITARCSQEEQQNLLAGWGFPTPNIRDVEDDQVILAGKARYEQMKRAPNRLLLLGDSTKILQTLQTSISKMQAPGAFAELAAVAQALGTRTDPQPQAFVISSLAGGSGSGMFMDVAELLKRATAQNWAQHAISFLYTPEVFSSLGAGGKHVAMNSLGVMNELIASKWVGISERSELLYSKLGLVASNPFGSQGYGCKLNFLIGARNDRGLDIRVGADGEGMDEVFLTVGEALAGAISSDEISDFLIYGVLIKVSGYRPALDISGLAPETFNVYDPTLAAAGIGYGQMTLGADRIVDYVADAMSRSQIETLLWPEFDGKLLEKGTSVTINELIQEKSDQMWPNFLVDSGLDERGSQNQISDALFADQLQERIKQYVNGIIKKNVPAKATPLATFSRAIWSEWETESDSFFKALQSEIGSKAANWVPEIQDKILNLVALELTSNGYAVVTNLTERLVTEMREHVIPELLGEHAQLTAALGGFNEYAFAARLTEIADGLAGVSIQNGPFFEKLSSTLTRVLEFQVNSYVNNLAASLVQDALTSFIEPVKNQLAESRFNLQAEIRTAVSTHGPRNSLLGFPVWGSGIVPNRYKSRAIERILIDFSEYESTYEFYARRDSNGVEPFILSARSALLGKKLNPVTDDKYEQSLVTIGNQWITTVRDAQGVIGCTPSKSVWKFRTDLEQLSKNNRRWLKNLDSSFGKFTDMSIRYFVTCENPVIRSEREFKFVKEFDAMLAIASPLVLLNPKASAHIVSPSFGESAYGIALYSSKIPFAMSSNVGQACARVLQQHGFDPNGPYFESTWFDAGSNASTMSAVATHSHSLPTWAFASLTEPILEEVARTKNQAKTWAQFWDGRRSRPLVEAIPFETEMRRSIITGWFISGLFGMRVVEYLREGRTVKIWNPTLQVPDWSRFPNPLLATHEADKKMQTWVLPQLLVSAGIALAEFGKSGDPEFINGYRLLKYLGREVTTAFKGRDHWDGNGAGDRLPTGIPSRSTFINDWITAGTKPEDSLDLSQLLETNLGANPDRRAALIATVEVLRGQYTEIWAELSSTPWHMLPETWELKDDIDLALSDIIKYIN
jgi:hypothetical protein